MTDAKLSIKDPQTRGGSKGERERDLERKKGQKQE
jgi:hypothetical protein